MLNTSLNRKKQVLALTLALAILVMTSAASAATVLIRAKSGGVVEMAEGVELVIRPNALEEDTFISADVILKPKRVLFRFGPDGTVFSKPAKLFISWEAIDSEDVMDLTLNGENGEQLEPKISKKGVTYYIEHFSLYYYRRR